MTRLISHLSQKKLKIFSASLSITNRQNIPGVSAEQYYSFQSPLPGVQSNVDVTIEVFGRKGGKAWNAQSELRFCPQMHLIRNANQRVPAQDR